MLAYIAVYAIFTIASYRDYKLIKHIRQNYPDLYKKYESQIGLKGWLKILKKELDSLDDEFINPYIKNL